jgi:hypothetical protein
MMATSRELCHSVASERFLVNSIDGVALAVAALAETQNTTSSQGSPAFPLRGKCI